MTVVVVGGHPDDPETGCGGTMALHADAGDDVVALYLTRGEAGIPGTSRDDAAAIRTAEAEAACRVLRARAVFAGQVDGATEVNAARYREFRGLIAGIAPRTVYAHWPVDTHPDHRAAALLAYDAWLAFGFDLYWYEVLSGEQTQDFAPSTYVDIGAALDRKRQAVFAHASQDPEALWRTHDRMHRVRGREAGSGAAEAFLRHRA
jgi:LmbE family N-acetylglucosaminyl deacetylase